MDLEELRRQLNSGEISINPSKNIIREGSLKKLDSTSDDYYISHGWDIVSSSLCDSEWDKFNIQQFVDINNLKLPEEEEKKVLNSIQTEDSHWNWFNKSVVLKTDEYEWFYLFADEKPQGVCIVYHPKSSILSAGDIFYIEYLAVAPWNRNNEINTKQYSGVGTILIQTALNYAVDTLKLKAGFCLLSLPQASSYYSKLGMDYITTEDKDGMYYFEMSEKNSNTLMGAVR